MKDLVPITAKHLGLSEYAQFFRIYEKTIDCAYPLPLNLRISDYLTRLERGDNKSKRHLQFTIAYYHHHKFMQSVGAIHQNITFIHYMFEQAVYDIQNGRYVKPKEDYVALIALILQYRFQDCVGDQRILQYVFTLHCSFSIVMKFILFCLHNTKNRIKLF